MATVFWTHIVQLGIIHVFMPLAVKSFEKCSAWTDGHMFVKLLVLYPKQMVLIKLDIRIIICKRIKRTLTSNIGNFRTPAVSIVLDLF